MYLTQVKNMVIPAKSYVPKYFSSKYKNNLLSVRKGCTNRIRIDHHHLEDLALNCKCSTYGFPFYILNRYISSNTIDDTREIRFISTVQEDSHNFFFLT